MFGDFVIYIKRILKQNFFCIHNYQPRLCITMYGMKEYRYYCTKCGKEE